MFKMISDVEVDMVVGSYENVRELTDLIETLKHERNVLKAAVANLMDNHVGSVHGWTEEREVPMLQHNLSVSEDMARTILQVTVEVGEAQTYDII